MREVRARRLQDAHAWSRQPAARTARIVGNVQVLDPAGDAGRGADLVVGSTFHLLEWHRGRQRMLGGFYTHHLRLGPDGPRILLKRVDLIDCDGAHDILEGFL
jgi:benzoate/toluate 1,2-dioxygenase beta subunit